MGKDDGVPEFGDPYEILGLEPENASDAVVKKSYREWAVKLHPDKHRGASETEAAQMIQKFHLIKEARAFLLNTEHQEARRKFDARLASLKARRKQDAQRDLDMTGRRRKMREELAAKEKRESERGQGPKRKQPATQDDEMMDRLRKEGKRRRDNFEAKASSEAAQQEARLRLARTNALEARQVRLKWSRSKAGVSHSDHSLATLLSQFGTVQEVELIGAKGNAALITFSDASSCLPCVEFYAESDTMRATFVGSRKQDELRKGFQTTAGSSSNIGDNKTMRRDTETIQERKLRQAAERERLVREMEQHESGRASTNAPVTSNSRTFPPETKMDEESQASPQTQSYNRRASSQYPPRLPKMEGLSPLQQLEMMERKVFRNSLPQEKLKKIQVTI